MKEGKKTTERCETLQARIVAMVEQLDACKHMLGQERETCRDKDVEAADIDIGLEMLAKYGQAIDEANTYCNEE